MKFNFFVLFFILNLNVSFAQKVHSHNDYLQKNPFWLAYESEVESIEVDVFLKNDTFYVAHSEKEINLKNMLNNLYLDPLNKLIIAKKLRPLQLLIDIKTYAEPSLNALILTLEKFPNLKSSKQLHIVISGERPPIEKYILYPDYLFFDHQTLDDIKKADLSKIALFSFSFKNYTKWDGKQALATTDIENLNKIIKNVHNLGYPIRFWATPDNQMAWEILHNLGIDFINTDFPKACKENFKK
jgi:alkaline phosphatase